MSNELRLKIAKQNAKTERQIGFYALGMKNVTRVTFSRNAHWNHMDTARPYYAHTKLQA